MNCVQEEHCKMLFLEEKWCHNYIIGQKTNDMLFDIFTFDYKKLNSIFHLDKDRNEVPVEITHMSAQMLQSLVERLRKTVRGLATKKKNGEKVGSIGFKTEGTSIFLKQGGPGKAYEVVSKNRIKLPLLKKPLRVNGLKQLDWIASIDENYEFSSATFDRDKVGDYFFHITVWVDKEKWNNYRKSKENITQSEIGIDFGCETTVTTSDGCKVNPVVNETERLKRLLDKKSHQEKHSNRWWKTILSIRKEYRHMTNQKNDIANKETTNILRRAAHVVIQDEQIAQWKDNGHGKAIQHSVHGRMLTRLKASPKTEVLDKWIPTTKLCRHCGHIHKDIKLDDRIYVCPVCGYTEDRDIHAAGNMTFIRDNFSNVVVGPDGSSFNRADFDRQVAELFNHRPAGDGCSTPSPSNGG